MAASRNASLELQSNPKRGPVEPHVVEPHPNEPPDVSKIISASLPTVKDLPSDESQDSYFANNDSPAAEKAKGKSYRFVLAFIALASVGFCSALDATSLSVALPVIALDLQATSLQSFWAGISYLLTNVLVQPLLTSLSDIFGRKPILYISIMLFGVGCIIVGSAKNMSILFLGRSIQGLGGGGLDVLAEVILTDMTSLKERPLYLGLMGMVWAAGVALGPVVGGGFSEFVTWRWLAWINLPFIGIGAVLIPPFLTLTKDKSALRGKLGRIDWGGFALFVVGLTIFTLPLTWGGTLYPWNSYQTILPLVLGVLVLVIFGFYERFPTEPMIPHRLFATRTASVALLGAMLHGVILWCVLFYLPFYFEAVIEHGPLRTAVDAFPLCFTVEPLSAITAFAMDKARQYRWFIWIGWILTTIGMGLMSLLNPSSTPAARGGLQVIAGIGLGILFPSQGIPLQAAVSADDAGLAVGTFVFARTMGSVLGVAIGSAIFSNKFSQLIRSVPLPPEIDLSDGTKAVDFIQRLRTLRVSDDIKVQILAVYSESLRWIWISLTAVSGVGFLVTLLMRELSLERDTMGKQAFQEKNAEKEDAEKLAG